MTDTEIFQLIANRIAESISEDWEKAIADLTRVEGSVGFTGRYFIKENFQKNLEASFDFLDGLAIHELYSNMVNSGKGDWNKLKFTLLSTGKFETDFIWDQTYQDEIDNLNKRK